MCDAVLGCKLYVTFPLPLVQEFPERGLRWFGFAWSCIRRPSSTAAFGLQRLQLDQAVVDEDVSKTGISGRLGLRGRIPESRRPILVKGG